jgi:hypothetical protein
MILSADSRGTAGVLLLAIVLIEYGVLTLVSLLVIDAARLSGPLAQVARTAIPLAPILMPAGFFLSSAGRGRTAPSVLIWLVYAGALSLAVGVAALGIALLTS